MVVIPVPINQFLQIVENLEFIEQSFAILVACKVAQPRDYLAEHGLVEAGFCEVALGHGCSDGVQLLGLFLAWGSRWNHSLALTGTQSFLILIDFITLRYA